MTKEFNIGDFLYGIPSSEVSARYNPEGQRVFIYNGVTNGDGYGMMLGWHEGRIVKSTGYRNFMWGGDARLATDEEKDEFIRKCNNQDLIKPY